MSDSDHAVCSLHSADSIGKTRGDKEERVERMHWALGTGHWAHEKKTRTDPIPARVVSQCGLAGNREPASPSSLARGR